jgi:predicted solute-binding protein
VLLNYIGSAYEHAGELLHAQPSDQRQANCQHQIVATADKPVAKADSVLAGWYGGGRGLDDPTNDRFVGMYVNELTLDYGDRGRRAIARFLQEGAAAGIVPRVNVSWVE